MQRNQYSASSSFEELLSRKAYEPESCKEIIYTASNSWTCVLDVHVHFSSVLMAWSYFPVSD